MTRDTTKGVHKNAAEVAAALAGALSLEGLLEQSDALLKTIGCRFATASAEAVVEALECCLNDAPEAAPAALAVWAEDLRDAPTPLYVRARLLGLLGDSRVGKAWNDFHQAAPAVVPEGLLHRSRARLATADVAGAARDLRDALRETGSYQLWTRAERLLRRLRKQGELPAVRRVRLAVLCGKANTRLLADLLVVGCFRDGIDATLFEGAYDNWQQELLDPASELSAFTPDVVLLPLHWRDAELPPHVAEHEAAAAGVVDRVLGAIESLRARHMCTVLAHTFDLPVNEPYGSLSESLPGGRSAVLRAINARLRSEAPEGMAWIDLERAQAEAGTAWVDPRHFAAARQHPGTEALVGLAERQLAALRAVLGLTRKVAVLDLDNTLWGGAIGEDGLAGIKLGPPSPTGESFQEFQSYLSVLKERGVLLAVCSKNNEADAREPFQRHPETVLREKDFVVFKANWSDKVSNLRDIAEELSLGIDSFVFVDDNPVERAWVRSALPDVAVPEIPEDPALYVGALECHRFFDAITLSKEDWERHESYEVEAERGALKAQTQSLDEFLEELGMVAIHGHFDALNLPRVAQLVNKTNQFNLTTRRYTEAQLHAQAEDPAWFTKWFRLRDRFGDSGLIGVLTCRPCVDDPDSLEIDNWLMSCRALGRGMEAYMFRAAIEECRDRDVAQLRARYLPTAKNAQMRDLCDRLGFLLTDEDACGERRYVIDVASASLSESPIRSEEWE